MRALILSEDQQNVGFCRRVCGNERAERSNPEHAGRDDESGFHGEIEMVYPGIRARGAVAGSVFFWRKERRFMRKIIV